MGISAGCVCKAVLLASHDPLKAERGVVLLLLRQLSARPAATTVLLEVSGPQPPMRAPHLPGDDSDLGHSGFGKCVEKLGAMPDDAPVFLRCA